ncbi:MAG: carbamoyltransferase C-terminal domain-containing protein [Candidatus Omnitrophota bacterium]
MNKKMILGISCEHDSGAALLTDKGEIVAAANEERFNRQKLYTGFPKASILYVIKEAGIKPADIGEIAVASHTHIRSRDWDWDKFSLKREIVSFILRSHAGKKLFENKFFMRCVINRLANMMFRRMVFRQINKLDINCKIDFVDHHVCHVNSAIHTSGFENGLALSFDAQGDGFSSKAYFFKNYGRCKDIIYDNVFFKSPAHYYGYATKLLNFRPMEHEGKVTGLAAFGDPTKTFPIFYQRLSFSDTKGLFQHKGYYSKPEIRYLRKCLAGYSKKDIAAGVQKHLEVNIIDYISYLRNLINMPKFNIVLSGGIFANVLLNQKISELSFIDGMHIHPNMGDGGLAFGASLEKAMLRKEYKNIKIRDVFLGPQPSGDIDKLIGAYKLCEIKSFEGADIFYYTAKILKNGGIVGIVEGRMEYGPRALCHRSIICNPFNRAINTTLNRMLMRTEFMPFAPIILDKDVDAYFDDVSNKKFAMEFMTITCRTNKLFQQHAAAANHVDNTTRPQIVFPETGSIYNVLTHFKELTGCSVLINTSFNLHGEPIVNTYEDAIRTFLKSKLDYLLLDKRLFVSQGQHR